MTTTLETPTTKIINTSIAIVGGGPAGAILSLLLAKAGVDVTLLEQYPDFNRQFRGDSVHPATLELLDGLGLAEKMLELPHTKSPGIPSTSPKGTFNILDLSGLKSKFPYFVLIQQARFLEFVVNEAKRYPNFHVFMKAGVRTLLEDNGKVTGVAFQHNSVPHEIRAAVTVAADGRHSMMRKLAAVEPKMTHPSGMDTLWFRLDRKDGDPKSSTNLTGETGVSVALLQREDHWQVGYNIPKGAFPELRAAGLPALQKTLSEGLPHFAERINAIPDFKAFSLLDVQINMLEQWHKPGLLFIGDSAHSMSPAFGVGINLAIQDAVATANILHGPLLEYQRSGAAITENVLARVQQKREPITKRIQWLQGLLGRSKQVKSMPLFVQWLMTSKIVSKPMARLVGLGWNPERWQPMTTHQAVATNSVTQA
jgi:2-polyprenyl-6-methoxyphenol hydroxylase-like FAD-dependent oxidoreductase